MTETTEAKLNLDKTFQFDSTLPDLPLPKLEQTLIKYLNSIEFLLNEKEYETTVQSIKEFKTEIGENLQNKLEERAKSNKNWLEKWWLEYAYLRSRSALLPYSNMITSFPLLDFWPNNLTDINELVYRVCLVTRYQLEFWQLLREQTFRPMKHKDAYWSMNQFRKLFNTTRLPGPDCDSLIENFKTIAESEKPVSSEIIVLWNGRIFAIKAYDENNLHILSLNQLKEQILHILRSANFKKPGNPVSVLTCDNRDTWYQNRKYLCELDEQNKKNLERIDNAIFVITLETDEAPLNKSETFYKTFTSESGMRIADKSINMVYFKNGSIGAVLDHTPFDGFAAGVLTHFVLSNIKKYKGVWPHLLIQHSESDHNYSATKFVDELIFKLDNKLTESLRITKEFYLSNCSNIDVCIKSFYAFGKSLLKKHQLHPEGLVQVALNLAYYRLRFKNSNLNISEPSCYCTASTRKYYNGRTETCRTFSKEFKQFSDHTISNRKFDKVHYQLLKNAVSKFQVLMTDAMNGNGIDRHLLGLQLSAIESNINRPKFFDDPIYQKYGPGSNYVLSTSCSGYWDACGGVPPMRNDGYSIFYGIEDEALHFTILTYKNCTSTDCVLMFDEISNSLLDIQSIITRANL